MRLATLAAVLVAVAAVAGQEEFTAQAVVSGAAIGVGFWVSHVRRRAANWWLKSIIAALVLLVARDFFTSLLGNPYDPRVPLVRLFLWLQVLHSFDLPARKDLKYSLASSVVLMSVAAVYARDSAFGLWIILYVFGASLALVTTSSGGVAISLRTVARLGVLLACAVLIAGAAVFAAIPRRQGLRVQWLPVSPRLSIVRAIYDRVINRAYPELEAGQEMERPPQFNPEAYVGFSGFVDLRLRGILTDTVVMRVRSTRPAFWRGLAFDEYTGRGWRMHDQTVEEISSSDPRIVPRFGPGEPWPAGSEVVVQTFYVEREQANVLFAAYRPFEVYTPAGSLGVDRHAGLRHPVPLEAGLIYSVISRVPNPPPGLRLRADGEFPDIIRERYLSLPPIPERVRHLARRLTSGTASPYEEALAVNRFLISGEYAYNLQAPLLPVTADAVDYFLFESKQGSCEVFASAMAVLLRAAGVPVRLVTGYAPGHFNPLTGYYEVRNSDAHAWVEVYIPRIGWIEFEPTPGFASPELFTEPRAGQWLLMDAARWMAAVLSSTTQAGIALVRSFGAAPVETSRLAYAAVALLAAALFWVRKRASGTGRSAAAHEGAAEGLYVRMLGILRRRGISRHPAQTPREFAGYLPVEVRGFAGMVTGAFEASRYGHATLPADRLAEARAALDRLATTIRSRPRR